MDAAAPVSDGHEDAASIARAGKTRLILEGPIVPTLARLAAPNVIAMFVTAATSIAEGFFAGLLGVSSLAGLTLVFPFVMLTQMLAAGSVGGAVSSAIARALGAGNVRRAERLMLHVVAIAMAASVLIALLVTGFSPSLFALLGGSGDALSEALAYAAIFFPCCIAVWLCHSLLSIIRGTGDMLMPAVVLALTALASVPVSGAFALGWGPFPHLGIAGLAAGAVIAHTLGALAAIVYILSGRAGLAWRSALGGLRANLFWDILRVGLVASVSAIQTIFTIVVMVGLVGRFGAPALAGYGLGARLEFLMMPIIFGIGAAMTSMVGANVGAGRRDRALAIAWTGSISSAVIVGALGLFFAAFPDLWLGLFLGPQETAALDAGRGYFRLAAPCYGPLALGLALYFASQGAGKVVFPVLAGICRMVVAVGGGLVLTFWFGFGLEGVFASIGAAMLVFGALTALSIRITAWR